MSSVKTLIPPLLTGTLFGTSLTLSNVYLPSIIISQLSLTSTYMLTTFLTASALSALIILLSNNTYVKLPARKNSSYGWFGGYDANVVGGLLQGLGMAFSGACPGTGIVQGVLGVRGAGWVLLGGVMGGLGFVGWEDWRAKSGNENVVRRDTVLKVKGHTVMERTGVSEWVVVLGYEALLVGMISLASFIGPSGKAERGMLNPIVGGCLIGGAQAMSVLLAKKTLGVSSAYSEVATHVTSLLKCGELAKSGFGNIAFAVGVSLGAKLVVSTGTTSVVTASGMGLSVPMALAGGFASIFGARMAGGCTSGHGISGMSTLSISSFVTVCAMFGGGIVVRLMLIAM